MGFKVNFRSILLFSPRILGRQAHREPSLGRRAPRSRLNGWAAVSERRCSQMASGDGLDTTEPDFDARAQVDLRPRRKPPNDH